VTTATLPWSERGCGAMGLGFLLVLSERDVSSSTR
jgi:hypothetical protein